MTIDEVSQPSASAPPNIILCGFMGTGKSTVGRLVAARLGWQFADTDEIIETRQGRKISQIFAQDGEAAFRKLESELCIEVADWRDTVIATGGGIVVNPANRVALTRGGMAVCLQASPETIASRLIEQYGEIDQRPMFAGSDPLTRIHELLAARAAAYAALPYHVETTGCPPEQVAAEVVSLWQRQCRST